jgi:hypothetical protein
MERLRHGATWAKDVQTGGEERAARRRAGAMIAILPAALMGIEHRT